MTFPVTITAADLATTPRHADPTARRASCPLSRAVAQARPRLRDVHVSRTDVYATDAGVRVSAKLPAAAMAFVAAFDGGGGAPVAFVLYELSPWRV
jgi:hypothetical protein